jgi:hypothetical protein
MRPGTGIRRAVGLDAQYELVRRPDSMEDPFILRLHLISMGGASDVTPRCRSEKQRNQLKEHYVTRKIPTLY